MAHRIDVNLGARTLTLSQDGQAVRQYPVGIGKPSTPTPVGDFAVGEKAIVTDPRFGTRWLGLSGTSGVGIHGTYNDFSVGKAMSNGCIRMHIADAQQLYDWVTVGTPVIIRR